MIPAENTMRWAVELPAASGGTGPTVTVDAESWKSALTEARGGRALTKFRVDFEEDGAVRVHDLVTNERFSLSPSSASVGAPASVPSAPVAASTPVAAPVTSAAAIATSPSIAAAAASPPINDVGKISVPPPKGSLVPPPGPTGRPSSAGIQAVVPPPTTSGPPTRTSSASFGAVAPPAQPLTPIAPPVVPAVAQPAPAVSPSTAPAPPGAPQAPAELIVPAPGNLFFSRDREAAASNGLTYRERLLAVPPGTSAEQCTAVAREVWRQLRDALATMPSGKFVSIAVFDHVFKSRPERPPIVVLGWKDWRGDEPEITVSRPSATSIAPPTTSIPPNSFAPPAPTVSAAPSQPPIATAPPPAPAQPEAPAPTPASLTAATVVDLAPSAVIVAAPPKHTVAFNSMPAEIAAHIAAVQSASNAAPPVELAPPAAPPTPAPAPVVEAATTVPPVVAEPAAAPPAQPVEPAPALLSEPVLPVPLVAPSAAIPLVSAPVVPAAPSSAEAEATAVTPMVFAPSQPPPPVVASQPPPAPPPSQPPVHAPATPFNPHAAATQPSLAHAIPTANKSGPHTAHGTRAKKPVRHRGDDLLSEAFDALSDMAFLSDSPQAVDFAAQVAKDLLHTPFVVVSLYDIDKHEIVIESCDAAPAAKGRRLKVTKGETRSDVMLRGLPVVAPRWEPDAFLTEAPIGPVLFAAIVLDRRLFGVMEIHRQVGEHGFEHDEEGAASYIASQLAQFLADHSKRVGFREEPEPARRK